MVAFTITFEAEGYDDKDEVVYAILNAIQQYEEFVDPRPIRWIGDCQVTEEDLDEGSEMFFTGKEG